jgi:hypothetical protein
MARPSDRATHEPSPKGLGHSVSVPRAVWNILKSIVLLPLHGGNPARDLAMIRVRKERELVHAKARQLCIETGMKIPPALRG